jgi:hypothetical protein
MTAALVKVLGGGGECCAERRQRKVLSDQPISWCCIAALSGLKCVYPDSLLFQSNEQRNPGVVNSSAAKTQIAWSTLSETGGTVFTPHCKLRRQRSSNLKGRMQVQVRLATICLVTIIVTGLTASPTQGQTSPNHGLKGITTVFVAVDLNDDARKMGLNQGVIETDVKLKLQLAGMRVVTAAEILTIPGSPILCVNVATLAPQAASIQIQLDQDAQLERNEEFAPGVTTWDATVVVANPTVHGIRDNIKDEIDKFLKVIATESIRRRTERLMRPLPRRLIQSRAPASPNSPAGKASLLDNS